MHDLVRFKSKAYKQIYWNNLFDHAGIAASKNKKPFGLANKSGFAMITRSVLSDRVIPVCFCDNAFVKIKNKPDKIEKTFLERERVCIFQLTEPSCAEIIPNIYLNFNNQLMYRLYTACKAIFIYTREHLSNRKSGMVAISKIETVRSDFSEIDILLSRIQLFILKLNHTSDISFLISELLRVLKILSRLAGARAVLAGNALELHFFLQLYQKIILEC